ncbi:hypothetical protein MASR2M64_01720 [Candidatus Cloacimonadota bacterium]
MKDILISVSILLVMFLSLSLISCFKWDNPVDMKADITPQLSHNAGTYNNPIEIQFTNANIDNMDIFYSLDGSVPSSSSNPYTSPFTIENPAALKAIAYADENYSKVTSTTYSFQAAIPTFSLAGGSYYSEQTVTISSATIGATIRYTTDGSDPTSSSTLYSSSILVSSVTTIKARAFKELWTPSIITTAEYIIVPAGFAYVAGGTFNDGTSDVSLSSFYLGKYELTQAEYQAVMGTNPAFGYGVGSAYPVYYVSWFNAIEYCNRRSMLEGITPCYSYSSYGTNPDSWPTGWDTNSNNHTNVSCNWTANGYRLPTEAEWEFAARGGNQTHNYTYSGSNTIGDVAWYYSNSSFSTHTVGGKLANELGLYDMNGNIYEWNWDIYGTYPSGAQNNPHGATSGPYRVLRGGSWGCDAYVCTVSVRNRNVAANGYNDLGFRLLRVSP